MTDARASLFEFLRRKAHPILSWAFGPGYIYRDWRWNRGR